MSSPHTPARRLAPRKHPKQLRSEATVEALVEAAAQVFERYGYAGGTTNRIAERAGVSIGSLYQYFPNKDAILVALVHRHLAESIVTLEPHLLRMDGGAHFDDVLPGIVDAMVTLHARAPRLHRVLFEETKLPSSLRVELEVLEDGLIEQTAKALARDLDSAPAELLLSARMVISAIEGLTHRLVLRPPADTTSQAISYEITELVRAYIHGCHKSARADNRS
jgi:AcrR family transcriptional regulator